MNADERDRFIERWLDEALAGYSEPEPRAGFEGRILARLAAAKVERVPAWPRLVWVPLACAATLALVVGFSVRHRWERPSAKPPVVAATSVGPIQEHVAASVPANSRQKITVPRRTVTPGAVVAKASEPRQPRFPAPAPPSEQERLIAVYLSATPTPELLAVAADQQAWRDQVENHSGVAAPEPARTRQIDHLQVLPLDGSSTEADAFGAR
jgi:hypothetical protein